MSSNGSEDAHASGILQNGGNFEEWFQFMEGQLTNRRSYYIAISAETELNSLSVIGKIPTRCENARTTMLACMTSATLQVTFYDVIGTWNVTESMQTAFCRWATISENLRAGLMNMFFQSIRKTIKKNLKGPRRMVNSTRSPLALPEARRANMGNSTYKDLFERLGVDSAEVQKLSVELEHHCVAHETWWSNRATTPSGAKRWWSATHAADAPDDAAVVTPAADGKTSPATVPSSPVTTITSSAQRDVNKRKRKPKKAIHLEKKPENDLAVTAGPALIAPLHCSVEASQYALDCGVLNAAVGMDRADILHLLLARIERSASASPHEEWEEGLLERYPTPIHCACSYARHDMLHLLLQWYAVHAPAALDRMMSGTCCCSGLEWPTSPFQHTLLGDRHPSRSAHDVLAVLDRLEPFPVIDLDMANMGGHALDELAARDHFLSPDVLEIVLHRLPLRPAYPDGENVMWRYLLSRQCTGDPIQALLDVGVNVPDEAYEQPLTSGNHELLDWLRSFVTSADDMWIYLHSLLQLHDLPYPFTELAPLLLHMMVKISMELHPTGFTGQTLCVAIMTASSLTGCCARDGEYTPREWIWELVDAMISAGADLHEPWIDGQRLLCRPEDQGNARARDHAKLRVYIRWTADEMLRERERVGSLL
ncbi:hypothetical protein FN846DRAFT_906125 [Sphaerosporella brunnea]|uniref:Uncharacterized protein n=1 Tax=Sphaerosporella brunnea TaxID=1250544 RepID=A0A5J5EZ68_9PEZI|nr:hypothetical protein FN846DRAFT_906125 [Sphaerosporella brunnea]